MLISSKANTQGEAMQLAFLTILPSIFFSGYIFPRETMPAFFYGISYPGSCQLFHQHHPRHHPARRRPAASLARRLGALRYGHFFARDRRPPLPNKVIMT